MSSHFMMCLHSQCGGVHNYLSVEEKIPFFTVFTGVVPGTQPVPGESSLMSLKKHYATETASWGELWGVRNGDRGMFFCRIRWGGGGGGCSGMSFWFAAGMR